MASYDVASAKWQPICKLGSGFTDAQLAHYTERFGRDVDRRRDEGVAATPPVWLDLPRGGLPPKYMPDEWLLPTTVWEVRAASLSLSPIFHAAAIVDARL